MIRTLCAVVLVGCGAIGLSPKAPPTAIDRAPDFTLPSHRGDRVTLATELSQRDVVIVFYRGHW